jgi:hypothetical protein
LPAFINRTQVTSQFTREEWEYLLVDGFRKMFPNYTIDKAGGSNEIYHETDILIRMSGILPDYAIAIQVKDYSGFVSRYVIDQINKAEKYYESVENIKLINLQIFFKLM